MARRSMALMGATSRVGPKGRVGHLSTGTRGATDATQTAALWCGLPADSKVLVDSAPFIYLLQDHAEFAPRFVGLFEASRAQQLHVALSAVTLAEVLVGPFKAGQDALARRYERALRAFEVVPVTAEIAVQAARLRSRYGLKLPDAIQLATALDVGASALVTHDRDFGKVRGLRIVHGA